MKKVVYKYVGVSETTTSPLKLVGLLILREGRTRQIINKNELLQMLEECLGDSVWSCFCQHHVHETSFWFY